MKKHLLLLLFLLLLAAFLTSCSGDVMVTWMDADGTVLYAERVSEQADIIGRPLPSDSNLWHYTEWKTVRQDKNNITYMANRVEKIEVLHTDADGTVLSGEYVLSGEEKVKLSLPADTNEWHYTGWREVRTTGRVTYVAERVEKILVLWQDPDGATIYSEYVTRNAAIPEKALPADTHEWHYTGWSESGTGTDTVTFVAQRVEKQLVVWQDIDGSTLYSEYVPRGQSLPQKPLPADTNEWHYTEWREYGTGTDTVTLVARRVIKIPLTWKNYDGSLLYKTYVPSGDPLPTYPLPADTENWHYYDWATEVEDDGSITYVAQRVVFLPVIWRDANGTLLHTERIPANQDIPKRPLPADTDDWHYVDWQITTGTGNTLAYVAERVAKIKLIWLDADGTVLQSLSLLSDEALPQLSLPADTEMWDYTEWTVEQQNNIYTYTAQRLPKASYFRGNVFQLVAKGIDGAPVSVGTGFVFHEDGWFITNYHVLKDAYYASAVFEIRNDTLGETYTTLDISLGVYSHQDKDLFIGKIDNYQKIAAYYRDISLQTEYETGETTYSIGYADSAVELEIHRGQVQKILSSLYDKLYSGVSYVGSSSYISTGSSGGILINNNLEVLGLTTLNWISEDTGEFLLGASIQSYHFANQMESAPTDATKDLALLLHPDEAAFIRFYRALEKEEESIKGSDENGVYCMYLWEGDNAGTGTDGYYYRDELKLYADGTIVYSTSTVWANNDRMSEIFMGHYSIDTGINDFQYGLVYQWATGAYYQVVSENINYSPTPALTLANYDVTVSQGYQITESNIRHVKEQFNDTYLLLYNLIEFYK